MSEEIIKVLNYLGEQLGIVIDWSAENMMPQVMDILGRYRNYKIVTGIIWIIVLVGLIFIIYRFVRKAIHDEKTDTHSIWWDEGGLTIAAICLYFFGAIFICVSIVALIMISSNICQWIIIPEMQYLKLLQNLVA